MNKNIFAQSSAKRIMSLIAISFASLIIARTNDIQVKSNSNKFMGEELGKVVSGNGELYYDEDKGCFLSKSNGVRAECMLKTKIVYKISVYCANGKNESSIDGVKCGDFISSDNQKEYKKLCNESAYEDGFYLAKNNGYLWVNRKNLVDSLVLVNDERYLRNEGEDAYTPENCDSIMYKKDADKKRVSEKAKPNLQTKQDLQWYIVPRDTQYASSCEPFELKEFIKNLMKLNWSHSITETEKVDGIPVAVQISIRQPGERQGEIYAFKGIQRCTNEFNRRKNYLDQASKAREREISNTINRY